MKVYNEDWTVPPNMRVGLDGYVGFEFVHDKDRGKVDQVISKRFYMYFHQRDIDTIDIAFKMFYDDCQRQRLNYFKVSYNDSIYFDGPPTYMHEVPGDINFLK